MDYRAKKFVERAHEAVRIDPHTGVRCQGYSEMSARCHIALRLPAGFDDCGDALDLLDELGGAPDGGTGRRDPHAVEYGLQPRQQPGPLGIQERDVGQVEPDGPRDRAG